MRDSAKPPIGAALAVAAIFSAAHACRPFDVAGGQPADASVLHDAEAGSDGGGLCENLAPDTILCDDFENRGDPTDLKGGRWNDVRTQFGQLHIVEENGAHVLRATITKLASGDGASVHLAKNAGPGITDVHVRFKIWVDALVAAPAIYSLLEVVADHGADSSVVFLAAVDGAVVLIEQTFVAGKPDIDRPLTPLPPIAVAVWQALDLHLVLGVKPSVTLLVDDKPAYAGSLDKSYVASTVTLRAGISYAAGIDAAHTVELDDIVLQAH